MNIFILRFTILSYMLYAYISIIVIVNTCYRQYKGNRRKCEEIKILILVYSKHSLSPHLRLPKTKLHKNRRYSRYKLFIFIFLMTFIFILNIYWCYFLLNIRYKCHSSFFYFDALLFSWVHITNYVYIFADSRANLWYNILNLKIKVKEISM